MCMFNSRHVDKHTRQQCEHVGLYKCHQQFKEIHKYAE